MGIIFNIAVGFGLFTVADTVIGFFTERGRRRDEKWRRRHLKEWTEAAKARSASSPPESP